MKKMVVIIAIVIIIAIGIIGFLYKDNIVNFIENVSHTEKKSDEPVNDAGTNGIITNGMAPPYIAYFDEEERQE